VLVLEREMHKAFAAFAAAEYAAVPADERGAVDKDDEPMFATMAPPAIGSPVPITEEPEPMSKAEQTESPVPAMSSAPVPPLVVKPPAAPFAPAAVMKVDEEQHAVAAFGGPDPFGRPDPKNDKTNQTEPELETPVLPTAADAKGATPGSEFSVTAETNAAPEPIAEAAEAAIADALKQVESSAKASDKKPEAAMAAAASADGSPVSAEANLSSLVDSMLAELKPKLMAELAKKLEHKKE
jgi:hypothetical protein